MVTTESVSWCPPLHPQLLCLLDFLGKCVTNVIYHKHFPFSDLLMCPIRRCFSQKLIHFILFSLREREKEGKIPCNKIGRCSHFADILGIY